MAAPEIRTPGGLVLPSRRGVLAGLGGLWGVASALSAFPLGGCFPRSASAGLGAGGTPDAGGGGDLSDASVAPLDEAEAGVLASQFLMEDFAIFAYVAAGPALPAEVQPVAALFADHHRAHQDHAGTVLRERGAPVPELPSTYDVELPGTVPEILRLALTLENQAVGAYHAFVAQHGEPALRSVAASILACETAHVVALLQALGDAGALGFAFATELQTHTNAFLAPPADDHGGRNP